MADLPSASVTIDDEAGAFAGATGYCIVAGCVERNADNTPRVFASAKAFLAQHGYSQAADYVAMHLEETKKPVVFVGMPTATAATIGRQDASGVVGSSVITVASGTGGYLEEVDAILTVVNGGTIGAVGITFNLSLDGGETQTLVRLGTATSYTVPYVGIVISFAAGTLVAGDTYKFATTAPMWDGAGLAAARTALASQLKLARSFMLIGDLPNSTFAGYVTTELNGYETANDRFAYARAQVRDQKAQAAMSRVTVRMTGAPSITFAEVGATGDTITRSAGSFVADGFVANMVVTVAGAVASAGYNNVTGKITAVSATILTLDTADLIAEGPITGVSIVGSFGLTFAEVGATGDTITRSGGSWLDDGFAVGDFVTFGGTSSNNVSDTIAALTATVMTFGSTDLAAEVIGTRSVTCTKGETMAAYVSAMDTAFASVDAQKRIDLGLGRGRKLSPITGSEFRRPVQWAASLREYQHDLQIPCWRKKDGPCDGWSLDDVNGNVVEYDERTDGGALAARFTCFRTFGNGPQGAFIALSLTRATEGSLLSRTHNMAVANLACTVAQAETENAIGQVLILNDDGTATDASLGVIEARVNSALQINLLQDKGEGPRASSAVWSASRSDALNVPGAQLTGTLNLLLNGTLEKITTSVRIDTAG